MFNVCKQDESYQMIHNCISGTNSCSDWHEHSSKVLLVISRSWKHSTWNVIYKFLFLYGRSLSKFFSIQYFPTSNLFQLNISHQTMQPKKYIWNIHISIQLIILKMFFFPLFRKPRYKRLI